MRSLIHLEYSFVQGEKYRYICIILNEACVDQHGLLNMMSFSPVWISDFLSDLCLSLQFGPINQHVCFYANTMIFLK